MICKRCGKPMREFKRSFHKQRKWKCPKCKRVLMQKIKKTVKRGLPRIKV